MLEPQSTLLFILLVVMFSALMWWMLATRRVAFRFVAATLSFAVAMMFGVMAVNKYYGYYETWGSAVVDLANEGIAVPQVPGSSLASGAAFDTLRRSDALRLAQHQGYTVPGRSD